MATVKRCDRCGEEEVRGHGDPKSVKSANLVVEGSNVPKAAADLCAHCLDNVIRVMRGKRDKPAKAS